MASLTQTSKQIRMIVNVFLGLIVFVVVIRVSYKIIQLILQKEPEPPKPNMLLGKLPHPQFLEVEVNPSVKYELDLISSDTLPTEPTILPVYKKIPYTVGLLSLERAKDIAENFGFSKDQYEEVSPTEYKWTDLNLPRYMVIDIKSRKYRIWYDYAKDPSVFTETAFRSEKDIEVKTIQFLNTARSLPTDIASGTQNVELLTWKDGSLQKAQKYIDVANVGKAYLQRTKVVVTDFLSVKHEYPAIGETPEKGPIYILISSSPVSHKNILEMNFNYYTIDTKTSGTYYAKTANEAWEEVKNGLIKPVSFGATLDQSYEVVDIQNVYLAYYDQEDAQDYLQPIWVFEGEATLADRTKVAYAAYVEALQESNYAEEVLETEEMVE